MPIPTIGVMGSGQEPHSTLAAEVADAIVELPANLLTGGGRGVMRSVGQCYVENPKRSHGRSIGIIPCQQSDPTKPKPGYPNPFIEIPIFTHLHLSGSQGTEIRSRNHINVLTPDAIIALPGGQGTLSEILLAVRYQKPIIAYSHDRELFAQFPEAVPRIDNPIDLLTFLKSTCGIR